MGLYPAHKHLAIAITNQDYDAKIVAGNIEHRIGWNVIRSAKSSLQFSQIGKTRMLRNGVPVPERLLGLRVFLPEVSQHLERDDVHKRNISL